MRHWLIRSGIHLAVFADLYGPQIVAGELPRCIGVSEVGPGCRRVKGEPHSQRSHFGGEVLHLGFGLLGSDPVASFAIGPFGGLGWRLGFVVVVRFALGLPFRPSGGNRRLLLGVVVVGAMYAGVQTRRRMCK